MAKVYAVYEMYHEHVEETGETYDSNLILKVFDSETKAIDYICDRIKLDHKGIDAKYEVGDAIFKNNVDISEIRPCGLVTSYTYVDDLYVCMMYRYIPYDLE